VASVRSHISSERIAIIERFRDGRRRAVQALYQESPAADQQALLARFESETFPAIGVAVL
jgi:hypothetical protein